MYTHQTRTHVKILPFCCKLYQAVKKVNNDQSILIVHNKNYILNIYSHYVESKIERTIWIAFYKNDKNEKCLIKNLPKDLVVYTLPLNYLLIMQLAC